jgi:hypothetical protein
MMDTEMLRPKEAAARFRVHRRTLERWATAGLIGRSRPAGSRIALYVAADIADLIAAGTVRRSVVPLPTAPTTAAADDWQSDPFWARAGAR